MKVEPASLEVNLNLASRLVDDFFGFDLIFVSGGVLSPGGGLPPFETVNARPAGDSSMLPVASFARTRKVWAPSSRAAVVWGLEHDAKAPESTLHSKLPPLSVDVNENSGVLSPVVAPSLGPPVIEVSGGVVSAVSETVNARLAGDGSALLLGSVE